LITYLCFNQSIHRSVTSRSPRFDVDALLHEGAEREPQTVEDGEVIGDGDAVRAVLDVPLKRAEPTHQEQNDADADVREYHAHPHLYARPHQTT